MYRTFLFDHFLLMHHRTFSFKCTWNGHANSFYKWNNDSYRNLMLDILTSLEPRIEEAGITLFEELEEINEVIFFNKGLHEIGYDFNGTRKFPLVYKNVAVIGAYNLTSRKPSNFIYRTLTVCEGYFIRRGPWKAILENNSQIAPDFKANIIANYEKKIRKKLNLFRMLDLRRVRKAMTGPSHMKFVMTMDKDG